MVPVLDFESSGESQEHINRHFDRKRQVIVSQKVIRAMK